MIRWSNGRSISRTDVEFVHTNWNECGNVLNASDAGRIVKFVISYACLIW